ncbi:MAG: efflux RND transporter periplasmic adaptor subunit [Myxococcota bacterium]
MTRTTGYFSERTLDWASRVGVLAALVGAAVVVSSPDVSLAPDAVATASPDARRVTVADIEDASASDGLVLSGTIRSVRRAELSFTLAGRMLERPVQIGDEVRRGQLLAHLDRRPLRHQLDAARAQRSELAARHAQASRDARRAQDLGRGDVLTDAQVEQASSALAQLDGALQSAEVRIAEAQRMLKEATLTAPFDGTVRAVGAEPGEFVTPGHPIISLASSSGLEVELDVPERHVTLLAPGLTVPLHFPNRSADPMQATVRAVGLAAGPGRLFPVILSLEDAERRDVLPGMTVEARFTLGDAKALSAPISAVVDPTGAQPAVFVLREGTPTRLRVELGRPLDHGRVVVRAVEGFDLDAGEKVITSGHASLVSGEPVEVAP